MDHVDNLLKRLVARARSSEPMPRLLVVLAHPDDEVLALGGRLERFGESRFLCVTNGAPENGEDARTHGFSSLEAYAEARRRELHAALALAGLPAACARELRSRTSVAEEIDRGVPDQESVFHLGEIARAVAREIEAFCPEAILTHPYEGGHPDHDSCAFAVHAALGLCDGAHRPPVLEAAFYHSRALWEPGTHGLKTGHFLPRLADLSLPREEVVCSLAVEEARGKRERLACFVTQRETLAQFGTEYERFRAAPAYDFTQAPHAGTLLFEDFGWGVTGEKFRELAVAALEDLGLSAGAAAARCGTSRV